MTLLSIDKALVKNALKQKLFAVMLRKKNGDFERKSLNEASDAILSSLTSIISLKTHFEP